jgi:hypothetical protein
MTASLYLLYRLFESFALVECGAAQNLGAHQSFLGREESKPEAKNSEGRTTRS